MLRVILQDYMFICNGQYRQTIFSLTDLLITIQLNTGLLILVDSTIYLLLYSAFLLNN